ncbi:hypothetical protein DUI87_17668 [Hirundo rustica rustica]|uniref:ribonuclease H n=1 Tax=Hirundo rustica rustica TaxID=333673 RepID=A0A3M0JX90_HIRRU|nr:hypothetical protein DUI87_17668 [Hirundo rustica rustica]
MKNSPVICQWYVASLLSPVHAAAGQAIIHHYMDDVLVCAPTDDVLSHALDLTINALIAAGFELQEEKVQRMPPWKYLGLEIGKQTIVPQKLAIKTKWKDIPKKDREGNDPLSIIEWVFLSHQRSKRMTRPQELVAELIRKARFQIRELASCDFVCIHIPIGLRSGQISKSMLEHLLQENEALQFALDSFTGQISIHRPAHKIFNQDVKFVLSLKEVCSRRPLKALTVFTDTSGRSHKSVLTWKGPQTQEWEADVAEVEGSSQVAELAAVVTAFERFPEPFNLVTDSTYVAGLVSRAEQAILQEVSNIALYDLLSKLVKKFEDDTKLSGVVARPEGCNAILGDLDKFEKWVHEVSGGFVRGSASFGMWVGANPAITQKANHILGCIKSSVGSRAREMIHLFSSDVQFLCTSECTYSAASRPVSPTPTIQYLKGDYKKDIEGLF